MRGDARYALALTDVPSWQAIDAVCDADGLILAVDDESGGLSVYVRGNVHNPFVAYAGLSRVVTTVLSVSLQLQLSA